MAAIEDRLREYEDVLRRWGVEPDVERANDLMDRQHKLFKSLRETQEGQRTILRLANDDVPSVQLLAATDALWFAPDFGEAVLALLAVMPGTLGFTAEQTLRLHRSKSLNLDW